MFSRGPYTKCACAAGECSPITHSTSPYVNEHYDDDVGDGDDDFAFAATIPFKCTRAYARMLNVFIGTVVCVGHVCKCGRYACEL